MEYSSNKVKHKKRRSLDSVIYNLLNALHILEVAYEEALFEIESLKKKIDHYENVVKYLLRIKEFSQIWFNSSKSCFFLIYILWGDLFPHII